MKRTPAINVAAALLVGFAGGWPTGQGIDPDPPAPDTVQTTDAKPRRDIAARRFGVVRVLDGHASVIDYDAVPAKVRLLGRVKMAS